MLGIIHVHSSYSNDGRDSLPALRAFAAARGLGFVGLSDHAEDLDAARFRQYQEECREVSDASIRLIPGLEFRFPGLRGMHLLALGLERWIAPETPEEFFDMCAGHCGLTVAAHPIYPKYTFPPVVLERVDAIEVWNAAYNTRLLPDPRAMRLLRQARALRPGLVGVAGLDQHDARNDRETRIEIRGGDDPLAAIRDGRFMNRGRTMRFGPDAELGMLKGAALWSGRAVVDWIDRLQEGAARRRREAARRQ